MRDRNPDEGQKEHARPHTRRSHPTHRRPPPSFPSSTLHPLHPRFSIFSSHDPRSSTLHPQFSTFHPPPSTLYLLFTRPTTHDPPSSPSLPMAKPGGRVNFDGSGFSCTRRRRLSLNIYYLHSLNPLAAIPAFSPPGLPGEVLQSERPRVYTVARGAIPGRIPGPLVRCRMNQYFPNLRSSQF